MEKLTDVQLLMFEPTILASSRSATSSPGSAVGVSHSSLRGGPSPAPCGPDHALASRSAKLGNGKVVKTSATSGLNSSGSSSASNPLQSLVSKSLQRRETNGSPLYSITLKTRAISGQEPIFVARGRALHTSVNGCISLPTPAASEGKDRSQAKILARLDRGGRVARRICSESSTLRLSEEIVTLNPCFAGWMMGFPPQWTRSTVTATPSSRP